MTLITIWPRYKTYYLLCLCVGVSIYILCVIQIQFKSRYLLSCYNVYYFTLSAPLAWRLVIASRIINIYKMPIAKTKHKIKKML